MVYHLFHIMCLLRSNRHYTKGYAIIKKEWFKPIDSVGDKWYFFLEHSWRRAGYVMKSLLIKDTTKEERERIVHQALWGNCGIDCEFCSGCDNRGGGRIEGIYQDYIDGKKEIREINAEYRAPFVRWEKPFRPLYLWIRDPSQAGMNRNK